MSDQTFGVVCLIALVLIAIALIVPIGLICTTSSTDPSQINTDPIESPMNTAPDLVRDDNKIQGVNYEQSN